MVVDRNRKHLNKAAATPFGNREGFELLHGSNWHQTAEDILSGRLQWRHPMQEVNNLIDQLRHAFDPDQLNEETDKINRILSNEEFVRYFKTKSKSTESLPSGWHMGHYKSIVQDESLVSLITAMLNVGLLTGTARERWKQF